MARTAPRSAAALLLLLPVLAGCSVGVPDPAAPRTAGSTAATLATPTVTPGYDAEALAFRHPLRDDLLSFTSALPADMVAVIAALGEATPVTDD